MLIDLLANASKYSPEHSLVRVVATPSMRTVCISVIDEGPGILPACHRFMAQSGVIGMARTPTRRYSRPGVIGFGQHLVDVGDAQLEVYRGGEGGIVVCGSQPHSPRPEGVE